MSKSKTLALLFGLAAATAFSNSANADSIIIENAWARETTASAKNGAAYMIINNHGDGPETLVSGKSEIAEKVEVHTHDMVDGVMKMRPVEEGVTLPAGGNATLAPGGLHLMLMGLKQPLAEGGSFPLTLVFASGSETTIDVAITDIRGPVSESAGTAGQGSHGSHDMNKTE